jgi:hypothetical protein
MFHINIDLNPIQILALRTVSQSASGERFFWIFIRTTGPPGSRHKVLSALIATNLFYYQRFNSTRIVTTAGIYSDFLFFRFVLHSTV